MTDENLPALARPGRNSPITPVVMEREVLYYLTSEDELDSMSTAAPINFGLFTLCVGLAIPSTLTLAAQLLADEKQRNLLLIALVGPVTLVTVLGALFFFAKWREDQDAKAKAIDRIKTSGRRIGSADAP